MNLPLLSIEVFVPLAGALVVMALPREAKRAIRAVATAALAVPVLLTLALAAGFRYGAPGLQFVERAKWAGVFHMSYFLGADGLSLAMLALASVVGLIAGVASYGIEERVKEYYALFLVMQMALLGVFCAEDLILFIVFFDLVLIPMYFLIGIWGHGRREYSALKFLIYTLVGSVLMLVGVLALYFETGAATFSIPGLARLAAHLPPGVTEWIFAALIFGFAVKVPVFPFHTWLPDAHVDAPTPVSVMLAAVLLKIGGYGFIRIAFGLLPGAAHHFAYAIGVFGVVNIIYGALAAMAQTDFKKLVAYSSVSHMGYVVLGVAAATPLAVDGAVFQMLSHGLISAMLFLLVGVFYDRCHTREMARLGGMYTTLPVAGTILGFAGMANLGLPTLSGFIGEFFTLAGTWPVWPALVFWAVAGIVLTAGFNLLMMQKVLMGPPREEWDGRLPRLLGREYATLVPLMAFTVLLGVLPASMMSVFNQPVLRFVAHLAGGA
jgi:NADH-quinone oxidoreductase subunit M